MKKTASGLLKKLSVRTSRNEKDIVTPYYNSEELLVASIRGLNYVKPKWHQETPESGCMGLTERQGRCSLEMINILFNSSRKNEVKKQNDAFGEIIKCIINQGRYKQNEVLSYEERILFTLLFHIFIKEINKNSTFKKKEGKIHE